ncbi:hypothetical protein OG912_24940 [Streptomyces sp. NBC_00464]
MLVVAVSEFGVGESDEPLGQVPQAGGVRCDSDLGARAVHLDPGFIHAVTLQRAFVASPNPALAPIPSLPPIRITRSGVTNSRYVQAERVSAAIVAIMRATSAA